MFGRKKDERPKRNHAGKNLAQYGLFDVPSELSFDGDDAVDDDDDLEAELLALTSGPTSKPKARRKPKPLPAEHLDALVSESLKDIPSDEDLSGDDDDPDLLNELSEITGDIQHEQPEVVPAEIVTSTSQLLENRLKMYVTAEENAKKNGETTRARRFNRGIKTLKDLIKQDNAGKAINPEDIPPEVSVTVTQKPSDNSSQDLPVPSHPAPAIPQLPDPEPEPEPVPEPVPDSVPMEQSPNKEVLDLLNNRKMEYKIAALQAKKSGENTTAINYMKIAKQFDVVIKAAESGQEVDLSNMPGPPQAIEAQSQPPVEDKTESEVQTQESEDVIEEKLISAGSIQEALDQRLQVYKSQEESAKNEGNSSKARRMGRIVKQFEVAIKSYKAGKPVAFDELPTPPGYAPIPVPGSVQPKEPEPENKPEVPAEKPEPKRAPMPPPRANSTRKMGNQAGTTHTERQVMLLMNRQKEFKEAALQAKKKNEIAQAKEFLRTAKGFDKIIEAARCGLPVDMESLPIPPSARSQLEDSFDFVMTEECDEDNSGTLDMLTRLEEQLNKQLKMCLSTRDHHKALGDVAGMNRFEHMALSVTRDLDVVRLAHRTNGQNIPKFHYENKSFSIVKCCTDLNDNDVEITIVRGINYACTNPKEIDTYVKFEFPYPQEEPFRERSAVIKDTNNPEYNATFTVPINRSSRPCLRIFKRQAIKFEIYSKGGFFRGDTLLGTVNVKLQPLETQCEYHESFDLLDGRKKVGGKLEVRVRVRHPLIARQVEQISEKWLVIDH